MSLISCKQKNIFLRPDPLFKTSILFITFLNLRIEMSDVCLAEKRHTHTHHVNFFLKMLPSFHKKCMCLWFVHSFAGSEVCGDFGVFHSSLHRVYSETQGLCRVQRGHDCTAGVHYQVSFNNKQQRVVMSSSSKINKSRS